MQQMIHDWLLSHFLLVFHHLHVHAYYTLLHLYVVDSSSEYEESDTCIKSDENIINSAINQEHSMIDLGMYVYAHHVYTVVSQARLHLPISVGVDRRGVWSKSHHQSVMHCQHFIN